MIDDLNDDNFLLFAAKFYVSPHYIEHEFLSDLKKFKYVRRLLQRYRVTGELKERLILNHIILAYNVFVPEACTRMLFLKNNPKDYAALKTFLIYLNYMPEKIKPVRGSVIFSSDISIDFIIANVLRNL